MNGSTNVPADIIRIIADRKLHVEFIADSVKSWAVDGSRITAVSSVDISGVNTAGEYVVMTCQFSDVCGDADNDGSLTALDAAALLKQIVGIFLCENPLMCDLNGDGTVNASDASAILKNIVAA